MGQFLEPFLLDFRIVRRLDGGLPLRLDYLRWIGGEGEELGGGGQEMEMCGRQVMRIDSASLHPLPL